MGRIRSIMKPTALLAALCLMLVSMAPLQAAMISTDELLAAEGLAVERADLLASLDREDVREQLVALGVDPEQAKQRVAALTDAEIAELNGRLGELPAGGDALAVVLVIFIVFVITDVIGATDIFPFIHPVD
jgi:hypothetical protein